jgi:hypothetical protein
MRSVRPPLDDRPCVRGRRLVVAIAAALLGLAGAARAGEAAAPSRPPATSDARPATVTSVVAGIVSYTRWPNDTKSIRVCTLGQGQGVDELLGAADLGAGPQGAPVRAASGVAKASTECDVVYVGALASPATRDLLQTTVGRPVLLIGEGREFCSDGGMFCLQPGQSAVRFAVNLDAIARSGLRVNPWVLRIARGVAASGS